MGSMFQCHSDTLGWINFKEGDFQEVELLGPLHGPVFLILLGHASSIRKSSSPKEMERLQHKLSKLSGIPRRKLKWDVRETLGQRQVVASPLTKPISISSHLPAEGVERD